jgi:hypothetical protein
MLSGSLAPPRGRNTVARKTLPKHGSAHRAGNRYGHQNGKGNLKSKRALLKKTKNH